MSSLFLFLLCSFVLFLLQFSHDWFALADNLNQEQLMPWPHEIHRFALSREDYFVFYYLILGLVYV